MSSVYTNVQANSIYNTYSINNRQGNHFMQRLASGLKIMTPKDNASVYAISERMRSQIRANEQANQNAQNDAALLKTAQGGISNTVDILKTLKERAINAANDSNLNQNRSDIATEVQQLGYQVDDNAYKVKYNNRAVLNGGFDSTVGRLNGSSAVSSTTDPSKITNPTQVATHAVYSMTGLKALDASGNATAVTANTAKVIDLSDTNNKSLLHSGDKVTLSWKENGALVKKEVELTAAMDLTEFATDLSGGNVKFSFEATPTNKLTSSDTGDDAKVLSSSDFKELDVTGAGGIGLYAVGKKDVSITDFSISVTSKNPKDGKYVANTEGQEYLASKIKGVQQSFGDDDKGSNTVFTSQLYVSDTDAAAKGIAYGSGNATKLNELAIPGAGTKVFPDAVEVGININGDGEFKIDADMTIDELNDKLKERGYNVRAYLLQKGDEVTYEGSTVTRGSGENQTTLKATANALYFVGEGGTTFDSIDIKGYKAGESAITTTANTIGTISKLQSYGTSTDSGTTSNSNPLTFFIGGEPNFGIEVTINKMDLKSLIGMDADSFAKKFLTKEGAESALTMIDDAISKALNEQTKLGAIESRLGYASDNLTTMNTNMEETDSVLRDADIAKDMVQFSKYSVLSQFAQAMLAQANNSGAGMLQFLQQ